MPTDYAKSELDLVVLVYPGVTLMDAAGPLQVFATASGIGERSCRISVVSKEGGSVPTDSGVSLDTVALRSVEAESIDTLIVAGGDGVFDVMGDRELLHWLRGRAAETRRTGSTCMGAFLLAAAGLLDGRRATTHWRWASTLQSRFPALQVESDAIYIRDNHFWTSAGVSAGIDLALAMVQADAGHATALEVARRLVLPLKRAGGQSQYSSALELQTADANGAFDRLHAWMRANLASDLKVERLAEVYGRSTRTFVRHYRMATGTTPAKSVERMRVEVARGLLEEDGASIARVATRCGFDNVETMRRSFVRCLGVSPAAYRARFGAGSDAGGASHVPGASAERTSESSHSRNVRIRGWSAVASGQTSQ